MQHQRTLSALSFASITCTEQKIKLSIKDFFSKCDQIRSFLRIWSHLLKKYLKENCLFLCSADCFWRHVLSIYLLSTIPCLFLFRTKFVSQANNFVMYWLKPVSVLSLVSTKMWIIFSTFLNPKCISVKLHSMQVTYGCIGSSGCFLQTKLKICRKFCKKPLYYYLCIFIPSPILVA